MNKFLVQLLVLSLTVNTALGQDIEVSASNYTDTLKALGKLMIQSPLEEERRSYQEVFDELFYAALLTADVMEHDFSEVRNIGTINSPDENFRIFTYLLPLKGGRNQFFGYILVKSGRNTIDITALEDNAYMLEEPEYKQVEADNWYGAIYYEIIKVKLEKKTYYTLLGFHPDLSNVHQKVVDVLWFDGDVPQFGASIFRIENFNDRRYYKAPQRLIMKYKKDVAASIRYEKKRERILIDHVSPPDAGLKGFYDNYGPDFTYDALIWKKQGWELESGVEIFSDIEVPPNNPIPKINR